MLISMLLADDTDQNIGREHQKLFNRLAHCELLELNSFSVLEHFLPIESEFRIQKQTKLRTDLAHLHDFSSFLEENGRP